MHTETAHAEHGEHAEHGDGDHDDDHDEAPITPEARAAAARVRVLQTSDGRATEVIGLVDVHEHMGHEDEALADLRARAAMLGADAVVDAEFHHGEGTVTHLSGMAVRFRDLLHGRSYDVIGQLDVDGSMFHEEAAYDELKRRASNLHADLIIGITFAHGESGPTHLTGTAIRFR
jgi:uncharacterized protein YbjQ (UPF0145 family)